MNSVTAWLNKHLVPALNAASENTYLSAVRAGMVSVVPLTIIGGLFVVLAFMPIPGWDVLIAPYLKASFTVATEDITDASSLCGRFRSADDPRYWLYLEASADALLEDVDYLLRKVWLECCGHMSAFFAGRREELGMQEKVGAVLATPGFRFSHEYDFGSTTILAGRVVGTRRGSLGTDDVRLLARNDFEPESCSKCSAQASVVCSICLETGKVDQAYLCGEHSPDHHCSPWETLLPVVNSPRMGVCGYGG